MRRLCHLPWEGVGCWLMPCPSWSVSQSCMRMKGSRPFCVSLLHGLGRDSMSLTLPWDNPSTWARHSVTQRAAAIVPTERDRAPRPPGDCLGLGWTLRTQHPPREPTGAQWGPWQEDINHPQALKGRLPTPKRGHQTPFPGPLPSLRRSSGRCRFWPTSP